VANDIGINALNFEKMINRKFVIDKKELAGRGKKK